MTHWMRTALILALMLLHAEGVLAQDAGVTFGQPVVFSTGTSQAPAVLVTNRSDNVKSFTVQSTWLNGDSILATAVGAVNDLAPGQTRAVGLLTQDQIPTQFDQVQTTIGTLVEDVASTPGADAAAQVTFGPPRVSGVGGLRTVAVQVSNGTPDSHSMVLGATFLAGDQLIGVATGAVNDLAPGQTKTATMILIGSADGADQILIAPSALL